MYPSAFEIKIIQVLAVVQMLYCCISDITVSYFLFCSGITLYCGSVVDVRSSHEQTQLQWRDSTDKGKHHFLSPDCGCSYLSYCFTFGI